MTQEQKQALLNDYNNRQNTVADIAVKYGVSKAAVAEIAVELGATPRHPKAYGKRGGGKNKGLPEMPQAH